MDKTYDDPRWAAFTAERERFEVALDTAIEVAAAIGSNKDSPLSAIYKQRYANALPKLVWLRNEVLG